MVTAIAMQEDAFYKTSNYLELLDPVLLLMSLVHMTGQRTLLAGYRDRVSGVGAGDMDQAAANEIRLLLAKALADGKTPVLQELDEALFAEMAEFCLRQGYREDLRPLLRDHVQFGPANPATGIKAGGKKVLVIGAGMTGIIAGIKLAEAGFDYKIIEARDEVGGTWSINRYPGVAVDTASLHYSLSFALNPSWSKFYPDGAQYLQYLKDVTHKFGIDRNIDFLTHARRFLWNEESKTWTVTAERDGATCIYTADVVITALGFFNGAMKPALPGADTFRGTIVHSAEWKQDLDLRGKKVVLLGSGCTAIQIAADAASVVKQLTVLQRQPNWILPAGTVAMEVPAHELWACQAIPYYLQWSRIGARRMVSGGDALWQVDPNWVGKYHSISAAHERSAKTCLDYLRAKMGDRPDLIALLTPDYPFFAKRPMLDCGYLDALRRPTVFLRQAGIARLEPDCVELADGTKIPCEVLVLATGFELEFLRSCEVIGQKGTRLSDVFGEEPRAYMGMMVPDFPNFFITSGPNSLTLSIAVGGGHNTTAELQTKYIMECLRVMGEQNAAAMVVKPGASEEFNRLLDERNSRTVWQNGGSASGYYKNKYGRPQIFMPMPAQDVRALMQRPDLSHYFMINRT